MALSPPLTQGEQLTGVLESMVTGSGPGQSVCSIPPGHCDWLRTGAVTNWGRAGPHAGIKARGARLLPEGVGLGKVRLRQWEGREVSLGQLVTFLSPSGQSCWPENEGAAEPRG